MITGSLQIVCVGGVAEEIFFVFVLVRILNIQTFIRTFSHVFVLVGILSVYWYW